MCLDLEDSVPDSQKEEARRMIRGALEARQSYKTEALYVRVNSDAAIKDDLKAIVHGGIDGIVIPKVNNVKVLRQVEEIVADLEAPPPGGLGGVIPSIESAEGVVKTYEIASFGEESRLRIDCILFGVFDLLADMRMEYSDGVEAARYARARAALDARAAGVPAIDGIWQDIRDIRGLEQDCLLGRSLGYAGKSVIHPSQIDTVHRLFHPTASEILWAEKVVQVYPKSVQEGRGATVVDNKMIDLVHYKQAQAVLDLAGR